MVEDQAGAHQVIQDSMQTLIQLIEQDNKIPDYDRALMRPWRR